MAPTTDDIVRLVTPGDAAELTEVLRENREFLTPWEPARDDEYFELDTQRRMIDTDLQEYSAGRRVPFVIVGPQGQIAGRINLNDIVRGAFQSCHLGYWLRQDLNGLGLASRAARTVVQHAADDLGLHRVEAGTLLHNTASQQVLRRAGLRPFAVAREHVRIAGEWQDHLLFEIIFASRGTEADGAQPPPT